jgi:prolyl oligopeptidase
MSVATYAGRAALAFSTLLALSTATLGGQPLVYPAAPRADVIDDYHGVEVADPYRWLEDAADLRTRDWLAAEQRLTAEALGGLADRTAIRRRLEALSSTTWTGVPWREGGRLFFEVSDGKAQQPVLYVQDGAASEPRVAVDPNRISPDGAIAVRDFSVSPDGRRVAFLEARGGEDLAEVRVVDLATDRELGESIPGVVNSVCWAPDAGGFFYIVPGAPPPGAPADAARLGKRVLYHRLGRPLGEDRLIKAFGAEARWVYCMTSADGRYALFVAEEGSESEFVALALGDPRRPDVAAAPFALLAGQHAFHTPIDFSGDTLFVRTDLDAPRGRVAALDLRQGSRAGLRPILGESSDVIDNAVLAGDRIVLHVLRDVQSHLLLYTLAGEPRGEIALPGIGAVGWPLYSRASSPELYYSFASFLSPATVYRCEVTRGPCAPFRPPRLAFDASPYETRQVFLPSKDGTRVPMFVTARKGLRLDGTHPAFLTAYGGYGSSLLPGFEPDVALWLEMGGVYAVANLRGGGEYGEAWHRAGMLGRKQTSFDDFFAAAEHLIASGYTAAHRLAIYGHSNGGLLIGAAITQRPELFAAAVANAGHYDMLRYHRFTAGAGWISEYGSPDDPTAFAALHAYSPLHNVRAGACYPATLLLAADHDDRVVPSHAYKFAAALQSAQACDRPVLLRVAVDASHSYASREVELDERADRWAFIAARLGLGTGPAKPAN